MATPSATACSRAWPSASPTRPAPARSRRGSVGTNSWCSAPGRGGGLIDLGGRLIARISTPHPIGPEGQSLAVGLSVGIALAPDHGTGLAALMRAADSALYRAKSLGKGRCSVASRQASETLPEAVIEAERLRA
ncbi:diguanylate cyclase domain-containing protein [Methylorubrum suomiense]